MCAAIAVAAIMLAWETYLHLKFRTVILVDGQRITVKSRPQTVQKLLIEQGIRLGEKDIVEPALRAAVPRGGLIRVVRVDEKIESSEEILPFKVLSRKKLEQNLRKVELQKGLYRKVIREIRVVRHDGAEAERTVLREREVKSTRYRLVLLQKDGTIADIYDLSRCKKMKMLATAYYPGDPLCWKDGKITFLGLKMQRGIVAVDPRTIPLRTRVYIPGYGYGYAADTGSAIKRKRIDLGVNNAQEEKPWMHQPVTVYILEKARSW
jgi:3D (Asp-Asp-Asp) domain-containing protein